MTSFCQTLLQSNWKLVCLNRQHFPNITSAENIQYSGFINIDNLSVLDNLKKNPKSFAYLTLWGDKASILSNIYTTPNQKIYIEGMLNNSKKVALDLKVKTDEIILSELYKKLKILSELSFLKQIESLDGKMVANFVLKGDLNKIKSSGYAKFTNASIYIDGVKVDNINSSTLPLRKFQTELLQFLQFDASYYYQKVRAYNQ